MIVYNYESKINADKYIEIKLKLISSLQCKILYAYTYVY